jgi:hypothetical protein
MPFSVSYTQYIVGNYVCGSNSETYNKNYTKYLWKHKNICKDGLRSRVDYYFDRNNRGLMQDCIANTCKNIKKEEDQINI